MFTGKYCFTKKHCKRPTDKFVNTLHCHSYECFNDTFLQQCRLCQWRIQTFRVWGDEAPRSSAAGARIEAPRGYGVGRGCLYQSFIKNGVFWSILMCKCASHVYTCIASFHFHQYKPSSYNYARVKIS